MRGRKYIQVLIPLICILTGTGLLLYPFISNYLYEHRQEEVIYDYQSRLDRMESEQMIQENSAAASYNERLKTRSVVISDPFDPDLMKKSETEDYADLLNLTGDGLMGYIQIPVISVFLPIYHGTTETVLTKGVGHLENTSLPVGGEGTHAVLSAHSGLSGKKLFTDLELLENGDVFYIYVLDNVLAYQIDDIQTVTPDKTDDLHIIPGQDYVTLVTCTPYGINSHRLLVRGKRIPYEPEGEEHVKTLNKKTGSSWMHQYFLAVAVGSVVLAGFLGLWYLIIRRRNGEKE